MKALIRSLTQDEVREKDSSSLLRCSDSLISTESSSEEEEPKNYEHAKYIVIFFVSKYSKIEEDIKIV